MTTTTKTPDVRTLLVRLRSAALRGLRMGVARGRPGCRVALCGQDSGARLPDLGWAVACLRDLRDAGAPPYVTAALAGIAETEGVAAFYSPHRYPTSETLADDLARALAYARREQDAVDPARSGGDGPARVVVFDHAENAWCVAEVFVTTKSVKLRVESPLYGFGPARVVVLKREPRYPIRGSGAVTFEYDEMDDALRVMGHEPPNHGRRS